MNIPIGLVILSVLSVVAIVASLMVSWRVTQKQDALFAVSKVDGAILQDKCMIRDGFLECPGVAVVTNDTLILYSVLKGERRLPLSDIKLTQESISLRSHGWWRKHVLHFQATGTFRLAIGVDNPESWRRVFSGRWRLDAGEHERTEIQSAS